MDITHIINTADIIVANTGTYQINYSVNLTGGGGAAIALAIDGVVDGSTEIGGAGTAGNMSGTVILNLLANDVITLVNNSAATPLILTLSPEIGAQLTIVQLSN